jgi:tetratricopeptide (TPR) repeat protein
MNQRKAQKLASEGYALYESEKYLEAARKYEEAIKIVDISHWATQDIYGEYAMVLAVVGRKKESLSMLEMALESALAADPNSNGVTIARHFLAEHLIELGNSEKAIEGLLPVLTKNAELKWLIHFSAANAYFHLGDKDNYDKQANETFKTSSNEKFPDVESVKSQIESNVQKSS